MIVLDHVTVTLKDKTRVTTPLQDISVRIPSDRRVGVLGPPKCGKSTLLRILSGLSRPSSGRIFATGSISFPAGMQVGIIQHHTLRRNCVVAAKVYRVDPIHFIKVVADAADLRPFLDLPFSYVPLEIQSKFKYALTYALPFDTYLMDSMALPFMQDGRKMQDLMMARMSQSGFILASANENTIGKFCDVVYLLRDGKLIATENAAVTIAEFRSERMAKNHPNALTGEMKTLVREARHLLQMRDLAAAEHKAQECYEKYPESLDSLLLLVDVARAQGNIPQANEMLKRACENFPDSDAPWLLAQRLLTAMTTAEMALPWGPMMLAHENPKFRLTGARVVTTHGAPEDALLAWRSIVGENPTTTLGLSEVAGLEFKLGDFEQALATTETELGLDPASWRALLMKARCERAMERYTDMTNTTIILAQVKPDMSMPYVGILRRAEQHEEAERLSRALQGLLPMNKQLEAEDAA